MLKNLSLFKIQGEWPHTAAELEEILLKHPLTPPGKISLASRGWVAVGPNGEFVYSTEKQQLFCAAVEKKVVPGNTLKRAVQAACEEQEKLQGYPCGKKQVREIKEKVLAELLTKAMTTVKETRVWVDAMNGIVAVDTSSSKEAEEIISMLREHCDGTLPVVLPDYEFSPSTLMGRWLVAGECSDGLSIGASAEMVSPDDSKAKVKFTKHEIVGNDQVTVHLDAGKFVSSMELDWKEQVTFTLTEKLQVKGIKFVVEDEGSGKGKKSKKDKKDAAMQFEADFRLSTGMLQGVVNGLSSALGIKD